MSLRRSDFYLGTLSILALAALALAISCGPVKPPQPVPTPTPTPVPTPTPTPTPTPPPPNACLPAPPLSKFECKNVGQLRVVIDCTPKTCSDPAWGVRCSTGPGCVPGGAESNPGQRQLVEAQWGPYTWTILTAGHFEDCLGNGCCFLDGGNPLRIVVPESACGPAVGKYIRITGGNGVFEDTIGALP